MYSAHNSRFYKCSRQIGMKYTGSDMIGIRKYSIYSFCVSINRICKEAGTRCSDLIQQGINLFILCRCTGCIASGKLPGIYDPVINVNIISIHGQFKLSELSGYTGTVIR